MLRSDSDKKNQAENNLEENKILRKLVLIQM